MEADNGLYDICVVVHVAEPDQLSFDLITDWGVKTFDMDSYAIRQFRGSSQREIIQFVAEQWLVEANEPFEAVALIFR